jgi:hypothetical protein
MQESVKYIKHVGKARTFVAEFCNTHGFRRPKIAVLLAQMRPGGRNCTDSQIQQTLWISGQHSTHCTKYSYLHHLLQTRNDTGFCILSIASITLDEDM